MAVATVPSACTGVHWRVVGATVLGGDYRCRQYGVVVGWNASEGRCSVELEDGRGPFGIKPSNLEFVC